MPTDIDHTAIKNRIRDILRADTTNLYNTATEDGSKFSEIETGYPNSPKGKPTKKAYIYITQGTPHTGKPASNVISNSFESFTRETRYDIIMGLTKGTARETELALDAFEKIVFELLLADNQLVGTGSALVDTSWPDRSEIVPGHLGQSWQERKITLFCRKEIG